MVARRAYPMPTDQPHEDTPPPAAVRVALHRLIDALTPAQAWALLQVLELWTEPPKERGAGGEAHTGEQVP